MKKNVRQLKTKHFKEKAIPKDLFKETTRADSSYYDDYQLRPYNPDSLWQKKGNYDLFDEMIEDDQISALLHLKKLLIIDTKWEVETENEDVKTFIEDNLKSIPEGFEKNLYDILSGLEYGLSLTEKIFTAEDGMVKLKDLKTRPPHSFIIHQDEFGNIKDDGIQQYTGESDLFLSKDKFIHFVYQKQFDGPYGRSELNKGVYTNWWSKQALIKFWNMFNERHGMPTVIGRYEASIQDQKDNLAKALKNLQAKTSIVMPKEVEVMLVEAKGNGAGFKLAIDYYNTAIARKMLIPDLLGYSGNQTSGGSFALGQEHFGIFFSVLEQIRGELARLINKEVVKPLVEWNFGTNEKVEFKFVQIDSAKKTENLKTWLEYIKTGKEPSQEQMEWFHAQIDAPLPIEKETLSPALKPVEKLSADHFASIPKATKDVKKKDYLADDKSKEIQQVEKDFNELEAKYIKSITPIFETLTASIVKQVEKIAKKGNMKNVSKLYTDKKLRKKLFDSVYSLMDESWKAGAKSVELTLAKYKVYQDGDDYVNWKWEASDYVITAETSEFIHGARPILADGIKNGSTYKEIGDQVKKKFVDQSQVRIDRLVRTMVSKSYNEARKVGMVALGDRVLAYEYLSILDNRTSDFCLTHNSDDNGLYKPDQAMAIWPPNHFNCRSIMSAVQFKEDLKDYPASKGISGGYEKSGDFWKPRKKSGR